jgi:hypothetical protein
MKVCNFRKENIAPAGVLHQGGGVRGEVRLEAAVRLPPVGPRVLVHVRQQLRPGAPHHRRLLYQPCSDDAKADEQTATR